MQSKRGQLWGSTQGDRVGAARPAGRPDTRLRHTQAHAHPLPQLQADGRRLASKQEPLLIPKGARSVSFGAAGTEARESGQGPREQETVLLQNLPRKQEDGGPGADSSAPLQSLTHSKCNKDS